VTCSVVSGEDHTARWTAVPGTTYTVSITQTIDPNPDWGQVYWTTALTPATPQTTTGGIMKWGMDSHNPYEGGRYGGSWSVVATSPGGAWTATHGGTWDIKFRKNILQPSIVNCNVTS
jgi:hypothetical protein